MKLRLEGTMVYSSLAIQSGLYCSPYKYLVGKRSRFHDVQDCLIISKRKYPCASQCIFRPQQMLTGTSNYYKRNNHDKILRSVVVRSEIAGTGSPGAAYQLSDFQLIPKVRGICFYTVTSTVALFLFVLMLVAHPFVLLRDRHQRNFHHFIAKIWASITIFPFFRLKIKGFENLPPKNSAAVYVSNHQSFLDIYTLLTLGRNLKFISKTAIFLFPVVGWAMFLMGVIPLKRMDSRSQLQTLKRCLEIVKNGGSVFFFPEGTRSRDGSLGTFKKGAFSIAAKTGVPVVPITLTGTGKIMPAGLESILFPGSVKVIIHQPVQGDDPDMLCTEDTIEEILFVLHPNSESLLPFEGIYTERCNKPLGCFILRLTSSRVGTNCVTSVVSFSPNILFWSSLLSFTIWFFVVCELDLSNTKRNDKLLIV